MRFLFGSRVSLPKSPARLPAGAKLAVVGESHYQPALKKTLKGAKRRTDGELVVDVFLAHEPTNTYDQNAVAVLSRHGKVGHLARDAAAKYRPVFDELAAQGYDGVACQALLAEPHGTNPNLAAVLELSIPRICLDGLRP